jgi:hypothetical protein
MRLRQKQGNLDKNDWTVLLYPAAASIIIHLLLAGRYGYFLDELYTLACSKNLSFGFVDIPPVSPFVLSVMTAIFGNSLFAVRLIPSLLSGFVVVLTGWMARELGGRKFSIILSGMAALFVPVWMAVFSTYTYDAFDQCMVILLFYSFQRLIQSENPKQWLLIGLVAGLGILTKPSMLFFIAMLVLALLFTKHRKMLLTPWPYLGGLIACILLIPSFVWQLKNNFPLVEYWTSYSANKTVDAGFLEYIIMQIVGTNVMLLPVWLMGLYYFFFNAEGKRYRIFGVAYSLLLLLFIAIKANLHMLTPAYAVLLAGGSVQFEKIITAKKRVKLKYVYCTLLILFSVIQAPNFLPVFSVDGLIQYTKTVGRMTGVGSLKTGSEEIVELPSFFYNRLEWDVLVDSVSNMYSSLSDEEKKNTGILTFNYGWAGALDLLGESKGLPKTVCGQLNYYFFSTDKLDYSTWIIIGEDPEDIQPFFEEVKEQTIHTKYRRPYEMPLLLCRGPKFEADQIRPVIKRFQ